MRKRAIPGVPADIPRKLSMFCDAVKENVEVITARRSDPIDELPETATTAQIIAKINEILVRLQ